MPSKPVYGGYICTGVVRPVLLVPISPPNTGFEGIITFIQRVTQIMCNIQIMIDIFSFQFFLLIKLFILFHPFTNLGLCRSFYWLCCQRRDPVIQSFCSVSMDATLSFVLNVPLPYCLLANQVTVTSKSAARITAK
jgi:hypothetical protein